ncbi:hypothetical protein E5D57_001633 [Metarhizium anisopliae]|nr:hypothetical protein E5D57_001633 [Metarhizium anisopliae]
MRPCFQNRTLSLSIHHQWHTPYEDIELSLVVQELINSLVSTKTPSEIYREIRQIPEGKPVTRHQVYYLWQKANAEIWQRDPDPFISATTLLSESSRYRDHHSIFTAGNLRALAFFASEPIQKLRNTAPQLVMDSTFGTNSGGIDLFAVLSEVEGTGVPLAYCLVELLKPPKSQQAETKPVRAHPGAMTYIIQQLLLRLKDFGFNPRCVAIDKDPAEITAVTTVWPRGQGSTLLLACQTGRKHEAQLIQKHQHAKPLSARGRSEVNPGFGDLLGFTPDPSASGP